eukprot:6765135-Pyramimonas_sp.AAC.1
MTTPVVGRVGVDRYDLGCKRRAKIANVSLRRPIPPTVPGAGAPAVQPPAGAPAAEQLEEPPPEMNPGGRWVYPNVLLIFQARTGRLNLTGYRHRLSRRSGPSR